MTSSLKVFHSRLSHTLFLFLSNSTKLKVAIFSSSVPHFVLSALWENDICKVKATDYLAYLEVNLPNIRAGSDLCFEKLFEIFEKFVFLWTSLHRSNWDVGIALWLLILRATSRNRLSGVFVHAPTISGWSVALNAFVSSVHRAFGKEELILWNNQFVR